MFAQVTSDPKPFFSFFTRTGAVAARCSRGSAKSLKRIEEFAVVDLDFSRFWLRFLSGHRRCYGETPFALPSGSGTPESRRLGLSLKIELSQP